MEILKNYPLVAAMLAIFITQVTKIPVAYLLKKPTTIALMFSTGGMPSSHSSGVTALITAIVVQHGWGSPFTAIAMTFGVLVMFDSMGVRRQSGEHGIILNELIEDIQLLGRSLKGDKAELVKEELDNNHMHQNVFLGHKPIEVVLGSLYGVFLSLTIYYLFY